MMVEQPLPTSMKKPYLRQGNTETHEHQTIIETQNSLSLWLGSYKLYVAEILDHNLPESSCVRGTAVKKQSDTQRIRSLP